MRNSVLSLALVVLLTACSGGDSGKTGAAADAKDKANGAGANDGAADGADTKAAGEPGLYAGQGIMVGELTSNSALVQVRLTASDKLVDGDVPGAAGTVRFQLMDPSNEVKPVGEPQTIAADPEHDYITRATFENLEPGTEYLCQTQIGADESSLKPGPTARFRTLPGAQQAVPVSFVVVTGMNYAKFHGDKRIDLALHKKNNNTELPPPYAGSDKAQGYPALASILKLKPNFFVGTGDNVYYDTPTDPRAQTLTEMRRKWHEQFVQPRYRELFAAVPTYWEVDDHDYRKDDCDNSGDYKPTPAEGRRIMLEQLPYAPASQEATAKTYRTHRVSKDLQIWMTEGRLHRSPNKMEDGPEKTIWGKEQKEWLKQTLAASDATFKLLISPTPMIGPDDLRKIDNHCDIGGFRHERDEFFTWLKEQGLLDKHFYLICGDRHWQYHSVDPSGVEEFSCGALVDANARLGRNPGDPKSTDAEGQIKQPYTQEPASGGFLYVQAIPAGDQPATLKVEWRDEHGKVLHTEEKQAK